MVGGSSLKTIDFKTKPKKKKNKTTKHLVGCHYCSIQMGKFRGWGLDAQRRASSHSPCLSEYSSTAI